ncbi:unnamed protein product [Ectocarpus sp. CCAP 1310/34]|nr:unnamed protein product [Ectocarpus sp. CCAP 1310/34]
MGSIFSCVTDEDRLDKHEQERLDLLKKGERFGRRKMVAMGVTLGSEPAMVRLSDDQSTVSWASADAPTFGSVKVTSVQNVKSAGATGLVLLGKGNSKELELEAADAATRDVWVIALQEVVERSKMSGKHKEAELEAQAQELSENKAEYWATRRKELQDVEAAAAERKKKYAGAGMQFTAQALANKSGSFKSQG